MDSFLLRLPKGAKKKKFAQPDDSCTEPACSKKSRKGNQMYLDFGQRSFGASKVCKLCGLLYVFSDSDDVTEHRKFCKQAKRPVLASTALLNRCEPILSLHGGSDKICRVPSGWTCEALDKTWQLAEEDLGATSCYIGTKASWYLHIRDGLIVGLLIVDQVLKSCAVPVESFAMLTEVNLPTREESDSGTVECCSASVGQLPCQGCTDDDSDSMTIGVRILWVHSQFRGQGVAQRLVDAARRFHFFACVIDKEAVAFTQPTEAGYRFALKYCGASRVLCYAG